METFLMKLLTEMFGPCIDDWGRSIEGASLIFISVEFETYFGTFYGILSGKRCTCYWCRTSNLMSKDRGTCPIGLDCPLVQSEMKMWSLVRVRETDGVKFSIEVAKVFVRNWFLELLLMVLWVVRDWKRVFHGKLGLILSISIEIAVKKIIFDYVLKNSFEVRQILNVKIIKTWETIFFS